MAIGSVGDVADTLLSAVLQNSLKAAFGSTSGGLLSPETSNDPLVRLGAQDLVALLRNVRSNFVSLATTATRLDLASPTSTFFVATVSSSDASKVTATVVPGISQDTTPPRANYSFTISQLAVAQANVGTALTGSATTVFQSGTNTFRITQLGVDTDVSFDVDSSETNLTSLTNLASAINGTAGLGVQASVATDAVAGTSQLVVQAKVAGTTNAFTLTNQAKTPVTDAGIGSAATTAANASYTQDGVPLTTSTNTIYLGSSAQLQVNFLGTTASPVVLSVAPDTAQIGGAINALVGAFNDARTFLESQADLYRDAVTQLGSVVSRLGGQLSNIGIDVGDGGTLAVQAAKLNVALDQYLATVRQVVGDVGGLAKELRAIADTQLSTPLVQKDPLPPFRSGFGSEVLVGAFAGRLHASQLQGMLVDALI
jgi:flagellar capping protein FliD